MGRHSFLGICYGDHDTYLVPLVPLSFESRPLGFCFDSCERPKTQMAELRWQLQGPAHVYATPLLLSYEGTRQQYSE